MINQIVLLTLVCYAMITADPSHYTEIACKESNMTSE